jgi:hypothetical protein
MTFRLAVEIVENIAVEIVENIAVEIGALCLTVAIPQNTAGASVASVEAVSVADTFVAVSVSVSAPYLDHLIASVAIPYPLTSSHISC